MPRQDTFLAQMRARSGDKGRALDACLGAAGDYNAMCALIERDFGARAINNSPLQVGSSWLCYVRGADAVLCPINALVWVYGDHATVEYNSIFVSPQITLWVRDGGGHNLPMTKADARHALRQLASAAPWLPVGYSPAMRDTWNSDRNELIAEIDKARSSALRFDQVFPAAPAVEAFKPSTTPSFVRLALALVTLACGIAWVAYLIQSGALQN